MDDDIERMREIRAKRTMADAQLRTLWKGVAGRSHEAKQFMEEVCDYPNRCAKVRRDNFRDRVTDIFRLICRTQVCSTTRVLCRATDSNGTAVEITAGKFGIGLKKNEKSRELSNMWDAEVVMKHAMDVSIALSKIGTQTTIKKAREITEFMSIVRSHIRMVDYDVSSIPSHVHATIYKEILEGCSVIYRDVEMPVESIDLLTGDYRNSVTFRVNKEPGKGFETISLDEPLDDEFEEDDQTIIVSILLLEQLYDKKDAIIQDIKRQLDVSFGPAIACLIDLESKFGAYLLAEAL